ncbi:hypothetical protein OC845_005952 [Tilletia horrida]|nr:hypothetical protein OC845_005952 [Tilletia horrida]
MWRAEQQSHFNADAVQGSSVIEKLFNANVAAAHTGRSPSIGGNSASASPKHIFNPPTLQGSPLSRAIDDIDPSFSNPRRPSLPSLKSSDSLTLSRKLSDDPTLIGPSTVGASNASLTSSPVSPSLTLEEEMVKVAADASMVKHGPHVLSAVPGLFASANSRTLQALPTSLSVFEDTGKEEAAQSGPFCDVSNASPAHELVPYAVPQDEHKITELSIRTSSDHAPGPRTPSGSFTPKTDKSAEILSYFDPRTPTKGFTTPLRKMERTFTAPIPSEFRNAEPGTSPTGRPVHLWKIRSLDEGVGPTDIVPPPPQGTSPGPALPAGYVENMVVKYSDPASLQRAMTNIYGLFLGLDAFSTSPQLFSEDHVQNIVFAALRSGVKHIIFSGHVWDPANEGGIMGGDGTHIGPAGDDLSNLPLTVRKCTAVYRMLRKLSASGLFRLTVAALPMCFEAALLCETAWFNLIPKHHAYLLEMPISSTTFMPFCSLADVGTAVVQMFARPEQFSGCIVDMTSDILSPQEMCAQLHTLVYISGKKVRISDRLSNQLAEVDQSSGAEDGVDFKDANALALREFMLYMAGFTQKPLTLLLPQIRKNTSKFHLKLTPWVRNYTVKIIVNRAVDFLKLKVLVCCSVNSP